MLLRQDGDFRSEGISPTFKCFSQARSGERPDFQLHRPTTQGIIELNGRGSCDMDVTQALKAISIQAGGVLAIPGDFYYLFFAHDATAYQPAEIVTSGLS